MTEPRNRCRFIAHSHAMTSLVFAGKTVDPPPGPCGCSDMTPILSYDPPGPGVDPVGTLRYPNRDTTRRSSWPGSRGTRCRKRRPCPIGSRSMLASTPAIPRPPTIPRQARSTVDPPARGDWPCLLMTNRCDGHTGSHERQFGILHRGRTTSRGGGPAPSDQHQLVFGERSQN